MELLLIRHGESVANAEGRVAGRADYPLSELGAEQARRAAAWLANNRLGWQAAYCSPLSRAAATARIVCDRTGYPSAEVDADLAEISAGRLEGLTRQEVEERFPSFVRRKVTDLGDFSEYDGESYEDVQVRVRRVVERVFARHRASGHRVLLVGHGGLHFQLVKHLVCEPVPRVCILKMGNCTATLLRLTERRGTFMGEVAWHVPIELMGGLGGEGAAALFR
jgi:broad specificity phosphatase PhoE